MTALRAEAADLENEIKRMGRRKADNDRSALRRLASVAGTGAGSA